MPRSAANFADLMSGADWRSRVGPFLDHIYNTRADLTKKNALQAAIISHFLGTTQFLDYFAADEMLFCRKVINFGHWMHSVENMLSSLTEQQRDGAVVLFGTVVKTLAINKAFWHVDSMDAMVDLILFNADINSRRFNSQVQLTSPLFNLS